MAPALAADKGLSLVPVTADAAASDAKSSALLPPLEASKAFGGSASDSAPQAPLARLEEGENAPLLPSNSKLIQAVVRYKVSSCFFLFFCIALTFFLCKPSPLPFCFLCKTNLKIKTTCRKFCSNSFELIKKWN